MQGAFYVACFHGVYHHGEHDGNGEGKDKFQQIDDESIFERHPKLRNIEQGFEIRQPYPLAAEDPRADGIFLEGEHDAVHGQVTEYESKRHPGNQHRVKYAILKDGFF